MLCSDEPEVMQNPELPENENMLWDAVAQILEED